MTPLELVRARLDACGCSPGRGDQFQARCPAHEDRVPSLSVGVGEDGRVLVSCHAGCPVEVVLARLELAWGDLHPSDRAGNRHRYEWEVVARYIYEDEAGKPLFRKVRAAGKRFWQERYDGHGGWVNGLSDTRRVPYRLPQLREAIEARRTVWCVEGERDVHSLEREGEVATTNPEGAAKAGSKSKWREEYSDWFKDADVRVIADDDDAGRAHARSIVTSLTGVAATVKLFKCPGHNDISDHLAAGGRLDELEPLGMPTRAADQLAPLFVADILKKHPELSESDVQAAKTFADLEKLVGGKQDAATRIARAVKAVGTTLFHDAARKCYATLARDGHTETWPIRSQSFELWVRWLMWSSAAKPVAGTKESDDHTDGDDPAGDGPGQDPGSAISATALRDAIAQLEAEALFGGEELEVHVRVAYTDAAIYVDLGDEDWKCIQITPEGWSILDSHPVHFRRSKGTKALPEPSQDGNLDLLRQFVNVSSEDDWKLLVGWLVNLVREGRPFPVLSLAGEHGTAKTSSTRIARAVLDPVAEPDVRATPKTTEDLMIAAYSSWVLAFDNLSHLEPSLSDALCRLATGGGIGKRQLYSDDEEVTLSAKRPVVINAIEEVVTRSDLLDRTLRVELPLIPDDERVSEEEFWRGFEQAHPAILGGLCDAISGALASYSTVRVPKLPRLADFAKWVTSAEPALNWPAGSFIDSFTRMRAQSDSLAVESSEIGPLLCQIADEGGFNGIPSELLELLNARADERVQKRPGWPKSPRAVTAQLQRISPNLRALGYLVQHGDRGHRGRPWTLTKAGDP